MPYRTGEVRSRSFNNDYSDLQRKYNTNVRIVSNEQIMKELMQAAPQSPRPVVNESLRDKYARSRKGNRYETMRSGNGSKSASPVGPNPRSMTLRNHEIRKHLMNLSQYNTKQILAQYSQSTQNLRSGSKRDLLSDQDNSKSDAGHSNGKNGKSRNIESFKPKKPFKTLKQ